MYLVYILNKIHQLLNDISGIIYKQHLTFLSFDQFNYLIKYYDCNIIN